jgi:tRNA-Thr(GGU) m(6)t(6)A37 methyltransferase TsaA
MRRAFHQWQKQKRLAALLMAQRWRAQSKQTEKGFQAMFEELRIKPIGVIETPFHEPAGTPIQPSRANGAQGKVRIEPQFWPGLQDLAGFERVWLIYWLHRQPASSLVVTPFLDKQPRGVFATRAPARPTPIGMSAVRLIGIQDGVLEVADVDILDGTPLLDIKPYVPEFDSYPASKAGWFDESKSQSRVADDRFREPVRTGA